MYNTNILIREDFITKEYQAARTLELLTKKRIPKAIRENYKKLQEARTAQIREMIKMLRNGDNMSF